MHSKLTLNELVCTCLLIYFGMLGYVPILMPSVPVATAGQSTALHGVNHLILFVIWSVILLLLLKSHFRLRLDLVSVRAAYAYVFFAMASTLWSSERSSTFSSSVSLGISTLFAIFLVSRFPAGRLVVLLSRVITILALASAAFAVALPGYGLDHQAHFGAWQGVFAQKNSLGLVMVFGTGIALSLKPVTFKEKLWKYGSLFICVAEVGLSKSREAWIVCAMVVVTHLSFKVYEKFTMTSRPVTLFLGLIGGIFAGLTVAALWVFLLKLVGRDVTLTGRTILWGAVLEQCKKHPLTGYGLGAFWGTGNAFPIYATTAWLPTSAHNGFLECLLELGAVGLFLMLLIVFLAFRYAIRIITSQENFDSSKAWIYCLITLVSLNMVGNITGIINSISWLVLVSGACCLEENARATVLARRRVPALVNTSPDDLRFATEVRTQRIFNT